MSNRRDFLRQILIGGTGLVAFKAMPLDAFAAKEIVKITLLHTNDVHSHIEPFPLNDPRHGGIGGVARRAALIKRIRQQEENVLLLDAGDVFQGTPYFNLYGGELEFKLMSEMGYDASTIGNHDFDNGLEGFNKMLPHANFPFLNANYDFSDTVLNDKIPPYKIFVKDGVRIGVFGLGIELEGLVEKKLYGNTKYLDPIHRAASLSHFLKNEKLCDLVICLSHLGFKYNNKKISDIELAKRSKNIDVIIGGHTHTFLDAPSIYSNSDGKEVVVSQAGWAGLRLGRIDCFFSRKKSKKIFSGSSIVLSEDIVNA
jgi:5'-nucleotidase